MKGKSICYFSNRKPECKEIAELACICGGEIHSFCSIHYENHLKNSSVTHSLIPNRQSSRILNKSSNSKISKLQEIDQDLIIYKDQLVTHINSIESISNSFIDMAKEISEFPTNRCNQSLNEVNSLNKNIQKLLRSSEFKNQNLIQKYSAEGLKGVLKDYLEVDPYSMNYIMVSLGSKLGVEIHSKDELEAKFRNLKKSSEQENFRLQEEVNKYEEKIDKLNKEMQATFSPYQAKEKSLEKKNFRLQEEVNKHERQIDDLNREMKAKFNHYQAKEKSSKQEIIRLKEKVNKYEGKIDELNLKMKTTFSHYQAKEKSSAQESFKLKEKVNEYEGQIDMLNQEIQATFSHYQAKEKSSELENFRLQEEVNKYEVKIDKLNQEMQTKFSHYQAKEKSSEQENFRLREEVNKHKRQIDKLNQEMKAKFNHYQAKEKSLKQENYRLRVCQFNSNFMQNEKQVENLFRTEAKELDKLTNQIRNKDQQIKELKHKLTLTGKENWSFLRFFGFWRLWRFCKSVTYYICIPTLIMITLINRPELRSSLLSFIIKRCSG